MVQRGKNLKNFFEGFIEKESLFVDKKVLQINYTPSKIPHRDEQIEVLANILAPSLKLEKPSNIFLYGKTGTGKTLTVNYVISQIIEVAKQKKLPLVFVYINCKLKRVADTEYRLIAQITKELNLDVPATGLPTDEVYKIFINLIDKKRILLIVILDEIDQLVKKVGDNLLYNFTRLNAELKKSEISIVGISNDLLFTDYLDPRVKSSLSEEELVFPPYNAIQIQDILRQRSKIAFKEGIIKEGVIEKCAAYAAREHGDARRALDLLRVAAELAERNGKEEISIEDIDLAEEKIEKDKVLDIVRTQPKQFQLTLLSIISLYEKNSGDDVFTGDIFEIYRDLCNKAGLATLTQRRVSDIIVEFDMLGLIHAKVISKGRYGRSRQIYLSIPKSTLPKIKEILQEGLNL
jgi:cell division control protein 6